MSRDILVGIISSLVTAASILIGGNLFGIFETKANRTIAIDVGQQILEDPTLSRLLVTSLSESEAFKGPAGPKGQAGIQGEPGPKWVPSGGILLLSEGYDCPQETRALAMMNIQSRKSDVGISLSRSAATFDSTWDIGNDWDGLAYKACVFQD